MIFNKKEAGLSLLPWGGGRIASAYGLAMTGAEETDHVFALLIAMTGTGNYETIINGTGDGLLRSVASQ